AALNALLTRFKLFYHIPPPRPQGGRPQKLRFHHQALGLVLRYYVSGSDQSDLSHVFAVPSSMLSRVLRGAEVALSQALAEYPLARISWPSPRRQVELVALVRARVPLAYHTFGFIGGYACWESECMVNEAESIAERMFAVQQPSCRDMQNAMYNRWLHSALVTGTICFGADDNTLWCQHNCPGSWNEADTSVGFRAKFLDEELCPDQRYGVVADSAFPCSND
ncbi:hypothetical protein PybrP1_009015, partial [[Pythium] brassicae (nom. inval.)]